MLLKILWHVTKYKNKFLYNIIFSMQGGKKIIKHNIYCIALSEDNTEYQK